MRPTLYNDEIRDKARAYVDGGFSDVGDVIPNVAGLAVHLKIARATIYTWAHEHKEFLDILEDCLSKQESMLVSGGLSGAHNSTICKLILTKHGYSDRQEVDNKSSDGSMTPKDVSETDREIIRRYMDSCTKMKK